MKVLLIVDLCRRDLYSYLENDINSEYHILWLENKSKLKEGFIAPTFIQGLYYWEDFTTPYELLKKIKPDKIVFFETIDLRQIGLIVASKSKGVKTFYLDHGALDRETMEKRANDPMAIASKFAYYRNRIRKSLSSIFKSKVFYYSVTRGFSCFNSYFKYLILPFYLLKYLPKKALSLVDFPERHPDLFLVFNKKNYEALKYYNNISTKDHIITGIPSFDPFFNSSIKEKSYVVFIDHPYLESNLLNWTPEFHRNLADCLLRFAKKINRKVFVKLHPLSNIDLWQSYEVDPDCMEVLQNGDYMQLYLESCLILSYASSLISGFLCAKKNVVLLGWHPVPQIFGVDFSLTGLCHKSQNFDDLFERFEQWESNNLCLRNEELYYSFLENFNYPFDGKAKERIFKALSEN